MAAFRAGDDRAAVTYVGGFFGIELPPAHGSGLASFWHMPEDPALTFSNGRSALAALFASVGPSKVWLPAYVCRSVAEAADAAGTPHSYFPVDEALQPDTPFLETSARTGDMVLAVDYFGRPPGEPFLDFVKRRTDLKFVEDACHAVDTGIRQWGRWCLRSPRKLVGVPDGGFVFPAGGIVKARRSTPEPGIAAYQAACLRFEDEDERANDLWHQANQDREASEGASLQRMTRLSRELLARIPVEPIAHLRRANFRALAGMLERYMFFPEAHLGFVPLGFPIRLQADLRDKVRRDLIGHGIFPAVHWSDLPSPTAFAPAHSLAAELLTLPCDQRYRPVDMERLAQIVRESLNPR
jgi:hypothetical protein